MANDHRPRETPAVASATARPVAQRLGDGEFLTVKVPMLTAFFWIIKALSTAMGESTSDFLVHTIDPVVAVEYWG